MTTAEEWGWFIREDIPYIDSLSNKISHKVKTGKFNKNNIIIKEVMPVIEEEKPLFSILDEKYDFGNVFATALVNTILICSAGFCLYFSKDKF
tara:strand:- start:83 stop:361 length:279 start_codon:yes stop_codon:yes gene_type:complete